MKAAAIIGGILSLAVGLPIWFYLLHYLLVSVNASELAFFLFWIYVPVVGLVNLITTLIRNVEG